MKVPFCAVVFSSAFLPSAGILPSFFHPAAAQRVLPECSAEAGEIPRVQGITVTEGALSQDGLSTLLLETPSGARMSIYFDAASEAEARANSACLGHQLVLLRHILGESAESAEWQSVVFTADPAYIPPRGEDTPVRWVIHTGDDVPGVVPMETLLLSTIPHEQVHAYQDRDSAVTPRWFAEGHATWVERQIVEMLDPARAAKDVETMQERSASSDSSANLAVWGNPRIKRAAYLRQVSEEDRVRMEADPDYIPAGSYSFTSDDFEDDDIEMTLRYARSYEVFAGLEDRHGAAAVHAWAQKVTAEDRFVSTDILREAMRRHFREDLDSVLAAAD